METPLNDQTVVIRIREHANSGMVVTIIPGDEKLKEAWLPHSELSYEEDFNVRDVASIHERFPIGSEHYAVVIDESATERGRPVVSYAAGENDPWILQIPSWNLDDPKVMVVSDTSNPQDYTGQIMPGVNAKMSVSDYIMAVGLADTNDEEEETEQEEDKSEEEKEKERQQREDKESLYRPKPGDRLAGKITEINRSSRMITLSAFSLFRGEGNPRDSEDEEYPIVLGPEKAMGLLTDLPELKTRTQVNERHAEDENEFRTYVPDEQGAYILPEFDRILILDDKEEVKSCVETFLNTRGFNAVGYTDPVEALKRFGIKEDENGNFLIDRSLVDQNDEPITIALVDVNIEDEVNIDCKGLDFAKIVQRLFPACRILLFSGTPTERDKILGMATNAKGLQVSDFFFKPVAGNTLLSSLYRARYQPSKDGEEVFKKLLAPEQDQEKAKEKAPDIRATRETELKAILEWLKVETQADSVFLFSMHPVTLEVRVISECGTPMGSWDKFSNKLKQSPVADVCLDPRKDYPTWSERDAQSMYAYGQHRFLLHCYGRKLEDCDHCKGTYAGCRRHTYKSCCATRVNGGPGDGLVYALFALALRKDVFCETSVLKMDLAARKVEIALREFRYRESLKESFPFLMTGRSACSVGHDLLSNLQSVLWLDTALTIIDEAKKEPSRDSIIKLEKGLKKMQPPLILAQGIAESYRNLSKEKEEKEVHCTLKDILSGQQGAEFASKPEMDRNSTQMLPFLEEHLHLLDTPIFVRQCAMVRVFQNLFNNSAQQAGTTGILAHRVFISLEESTMNSEDGDNLEGIQIDVMDSGPGLHWSDRKRIFEPRFTTRRTGSGMGLHIVKEEIEGAGGTVEVFESVLGVGTCMRVWLPRNESEAS